MSTTGESYTCPRCERTSHNPSDVRESYCGHCHTFAQQLVDMVIVAWIGPDEFDGTRGIKSGVTRIGWVPLVAKSEHEGHLRSSSLRAQLQNQSNAHDVPMYLARFRFDGIIERLEPGN